MWCVFQREGEDEAERGDLAQAAEPGQGESPGNSHKPGTQTWHTIMLHVHLIYLFCQNSFCCILIANIL